jgi:hypothetical protein
MQNKDKNSRSANRTRLTTVFDLSTMVEELAEALYAGRCPPDGVLYSTDVDLQGIVKSQSSSPEHSTKEIGRNDLSFIIQIEREDTWIVESDRRCLEKDCHELTWQCP